MGKFRKTLYRRVRYSGITEWLQFQVRKSPKLYLGAINLVMDVNPDDIIIDCGANVGDVTSMFARSCATVYAFEPNPLCTAILDKRFKHIPNVHILNNGVMDRRCILTLFTPDSHAGFDAIDTTLAASFMPGALHSDEYTMKKVDVECIDLDEFIKGLGRRVRLLKVDIEGAELPVLNKLIDTGTIDQVDQVIVETHEVQMPHLADETNVLRKRLQERGLIDKIRLDWY